MGLRTILIIMLAYYVLKIVARMAFPHIMKRAMDKMNAKMQEQQGYKQTKNQEIGKTVVDKKPTSKTSNNSVGEYVDYEEVD